MPLVESTCMLERDHQKTLLYKRNMQEAQTMHTLRIFCGCPKDIPYFGNGPFVPFASADAHKIIQRKCSKV